MRQEHFKQMTFNYFCLKNDVHVLGSLHSMYRTYIYTKKFYGGKTMESITQKSVAAEGHADRPVKTIPVNSCPGVADATGWLRSSLGCAFGRKEASSGRIKTVFINNFGDFLREEEAFFEEVRAGSMLSCLYVVRLPWDHGEALSAQQVLDLLTERGFGHSSNSGGSTWNTRSEVLVCPVTQYRAIFPDFDLTAFFPKAGDPSEPLYDPANYAPFVCLSQTSDIFSFATFTRDLSNRLFKEEPAQLDPASLDQVFSKSQQLWQQLAVATVQHFNKVSDRTRGCPMHLESDSRHYIAPHYESAFFETEKLYARLEMPATYTERIVGVWRASLRDSKEPIYDNVISSGVVV